MKKYFILLSIIIILLSYPICKFFSNPILYNISSEINDINEKAREIDDLNLDTKEFFDNLILMYKTKIENVQEISNEISDSSLKAELNNFCTALDYKVKAYEIYKYINLNNKAEDKYVKFDEFDRLIKISQEYLFNSLNNLKNNHNIKISNKLIEEASLLVDKTNN